MTHFIFYKATQPDSIIREIRGYVGKIENMKKQGYGEYIIEYHYSNENPETILEMEESSLTNNYEKN